MNKQYSNKQPIKMMEENTDLVAHKVPAYLNNKQSSWMKDNCIASRLAYNFAIDRLRHPIMTYEGCLEAADQPTKFSSRIDGAIQPALLDFKKVQFPSAFDVSKQWTIERDILYPWIKERGLNLDTISGVFNNNYGAALNQWKIAKWSKDKMPAYHGKGSRLSSTWRGKNIKQVDKTHFVLPNKKGVFRIAQPLRFVGEVRSVTFSEVAGQWMASFLIKTKLPIQKPAPSGTLIGVDVGVVQFVSLSNGEQCPPSQDYQHALDRLAKQQQKLSRMDGPIKGQRKASKNWLKQKQKIQKLHREITEKRRYYTEVVSKDLASRFETIAIEDLKLKNMTASANGTIENPGKQVAQKAGLNRSILNGGFYQFRSRLEAKAKARCGTVITVDPRYTSQTCASCGHVAKENRKDQATFECVECGHTNNADVNAAQNILLRALSPEQKIVVPLRRKADEGHQGASHPGSLPTDFVGSLAQEAVKQGASSGTATRRESEQFTLSF